MKNEFKLSDLPKHNIYEVPDKYFDRLPTQIMERTAGAGYSPAPWYAAIWKPLRLALVRLCIAVGSRRGILYPTARAATRPAVALSAVDHDDIMDYLSTYAVLESSDFAEYTSLSERK